MRTFDFHILTLLDIFCILGHLATVHFRKRVHISKKKKSVSLTSQSNFSMAITAHTILHFINNICGIHDLIATVNKTNIRCVTGSLLGLQYKECVVLHNMTGKLHLSIYSDNSAFQKLVLKWPLPTQEQKGTFLLSVLSSFDYTLTMLLIFKTQMCVNISFTVQ